ncbi:MAG: Acetylornithine aminotransferase [Brockia lithotrophica]|uniref:Acetylornithine aminotransferase n=1 Tax=Brockia lithotrophica TaxID=933949 RepID=A0A2T5G5H2_9BACL|nr:MAG: Acetylornithine aminotransferase [Brockia lithotrophica]
MNENDVWSFSPAPFLPVYRRYPVRIVRGEGVYVWDDRGRRYLDFTSGVAVLNLGHVPPPVRRALEEQLGRVWHVSNLFWNEPGERLAERLVALTFPGAVFFANSGTEVVEAALKLARRHAFLARGLREGEGEFVAFSRSFHGRTIGALSVTGRPAFHEGYTPLWSNVRFLPYNDLDALEEIVPERTYAVILELVQGEGGVYPADPGWVQSLLARVRPHGVPVIVDEVQTGVGRTGPLWAYEAYGFTPDILTSAKGLGSGFPVAAMLAREPFAEAFTPGSHGSTFGGGPLAATAALVTLEVVADPAFLADSQRRAERLRRGLEEIAREDGRFVVRGRGWLLGLDFGRPVGEVVDRLREEEAVLVLTAGETVVRVLPPLVAGEGEIDFFLAALRGVLRRLGG